MNYLFVKKVWLSFIEREDGLQQTTDGLNLRRRFLDATRAVKRKQAIATLTITDSNLRSDGKTNSSVIHARARGGFPSSVVVVVVGATPMPR